MSSGGLASGARNHEAERHRQLALAVAASQRHGRRVGTTKSADTCVGRKRARGPRP